MRSFGDFTTSLNRDIELLITEPIYPKSLNSPDNVDHDANSTGGVDTGGGKW